MDGLFDFEYDIGSLIREERKAQGMTMKELGKAIGVTEQAISQYELGKRPVKYETVEKIVKAFGMSLPVFLDQYGLYDEQIPSHFDGDVDAYESFKSALETDQWMDSAIGTEKIRAVTLFLELCGFKYTYEKGLIIDGKGTAHKLSTRDFYTLCADLFDSLEGFAIFKTTELLQSLTQKED
jgi:transcriptional regulator with XRE-family HTH domain